LLALNRLERLCLKLQSHKLITHKGKLSVKRVYNIRLSKRERIGEKMKKNEIEP
jgi:hypothetical protein